MVITMNCWSNADSNPLVFCIIRQSCKLSPLTRKEGENSTTITWISSLRYKLLVDGQDINAYAASAGK